MSLSLLITKEEILKLPNNYDLGSYVRKKYNRISEQINSYVSDDGYDLCVICGKKTPYKTEEHISSRLGYIEGVGQTCPEQNKCDNRTN